MKKRTIPVILVLTMLLVVFSIANAMAYWFSDFIDDLNDILVKTNREIDEVLANNNNEVHVILAQKNTEIHNISGDNPELNEILIETTVN